MKTANIYEIGERVAVPAKVVKREFDDRGGIKYKLKDEKTGKIFDWYYTNNDLVEVPMPTPAPKKKETKK